jgi:hypothetical protein
MKTLAKVFFVCVACLSANLFVGCSEDPVTDNTPKRAIPKKGSTYNYVRSERAATDPYAPVAGTDSTHMVTSQDNYISFSGKDTVITFLDVNTMNPSAGADTMRIAYEGNGDISIYRGNGLEGLPVLPVSIPVWWQLPFKSKSAITIFDQILDITFDLGGVQVTVKKVTGTSIGSVTSSNLEINGKSYACDRADVTFTVTGTATVGISIPVTLVFKTTYLLNEEIGYFAMFDTQNEVPSLAQTFLPPYNYIQVLTSFDVKK